MEPRNYESGAAGSPPSAPESPSSGYPTGGDPQTATPATKPGAHWFYKVGESLRKIITDAGLTPDDADLGQLKTALVSPQADVDAGTDDNRFVTPKKLRWGFSASLASSNGYIFFPSWLGGFVIQWMSLVIPSGQTSFGPVSPPIAFPNAIRATALNHSTTTVVGAAGVYCAQIDGATQQITMRQEFSRAVAEGYNLIIFGN